MSKYIQDPDARLDYKIDWSNWLDTDDWIASARASAQTGITIDTSAQTSTVHSFFLTGGTVGEEYEVTSHIWTNGGREDDRTIIIIVEEQ